MKITTIGLDIAKNVFQIHGVDAAEKVVVKKQLRRNKLMEFFNTLPPCLIGMEACATAHYWARELTRSSLDATEGREGLPQAQQERSGRRRCNLRGRAAPDDAVRAGQVGGAAGAIGAAPHPRSADAQRTQLINALRGHLAEFGIVAAQGDAGLKELLAIVANDRDGRLPSDARACVIVLAAQLDAVQTMLSSLDKRIMKQHRANEASRRLETIPGIGVIGASAIAATVSDPMVFRSGRDFAAWIGLVPRQDSTGGKQKLGPISKQGDQYLRRILIVGAHSVLRRAKENPLKYPWLTQLLARRPFKVVAVALANKTARIAWALLAHGGTYRMLQLAAAA
jgi:transposase